MKSKQCPTHSSYFVKIICLQLQSSLLSFYAVPSSGQLKGALVHLIAFKSAAEFLNTFWRFSILTAYTFRFKCCTNAVIKGHLEFNKVKFFAGLLARIMNLLLTNIWQRCFPPPTYLPSTFNLDQFSVSPLPLQLLIFFCVATWR